MSKINTHKSIDSFLEELELPKSQYSSFYIVQYEKYNSEINLNTYTYRHNFFEISLVIGYDAEVKIGAQKENISDCSLIFVSPNQKVTWKANEKFQNAKSYLLLFSPEIFGDSMDTFNLLSKYSFFNRYTDSLYQLSQKQIKLFANLLLEMDKEYNHPDSETETLLASYLSILLTKFKRQLHIQENVNYNRSRAHQITLKYEQLLVQEKNPRRPIKYYADKINISSIYLAECLKKVTQRNYKELVNDYAMLKAKSMIKNGEYSIQEVAYTLGFEESTNFTKYFKRHSGLTPKQFRNT